MNRIILIGIGVAVWIAPALAQQSPAPAVPPTEAAAPPPAAAPQPPPDTPPAAVPFTYNAEGRRDPFISLVGRGVGSTTDRPSGLPGQLINEVSLKGIVKDPNGYYALVQASDTRTYVIRAGDRLLDGTVKAVTADAVVFSQDVNDPLSLQKQREIRKSLRPGEESRG